MSDPTQRKSQRQPAKKVDDDNIDAEGLDLLCAAVEHDSSSGLSADKDSAAEGGKFKRIIHDLIVSIT